ncbi:MAG: FliH/SctL family protein [Chloroflexota bacterium]|nr:FliH/SctL family protein [Dehalococcoidia bacterium]MDW8255331.1 FliH/SctL family protein [Chloroflexota bacterium]
MGRVVKAAAVELVEPHPVGPAAPSAAPPASPKPEEESAARAAALLAEAEARAAQVVAEAEARAEAILNEAKKAALQTELDAYEAGKAEGYQAGREAGLASLERLVALAENATLEWERAVRAAEEQIIDLAIAIASRIVGQVREENRSTVLAAVMQALDHLAASPTVTVRVHPDDYDLVTTHWAETRGPRYRDREWTFVADRSIEPGGCVLELEGGRIDAQLGTQLREIRRALRAAGGFDDRAS